MATKIVTIHAAARCPFTSRRLSGAQWTQSDKSVIAGKSTHFARQLPETLRSDVVHHVPDATHRNLRFWFTPDAFEQASCTQIALCAESANWAIS